MPDGSLVGTFCGCAARPVVADATTLCAVVGRLRSLGCVDLATVNLALNFELGCNTGALEGVVVVFVLPLVVRAECLGVGTLGDKV